jgi:hypothetical protein
LLQAATGHRGLLGPDQWGSVIISREKPGGF